MATLYTNFSIQGSPSYYPVFEEEEYGQGKSVTFTTGSLAIPPSDVAMNGRYYDAVDVLGGVYEEDCTGLVFMAYPSNDYRSAPLVFANKNSITLPTEVGGTVEGTLDAVEFEEISEESGDEVS